MHQCLAILHQLIRTGYRWGKTSWISGCPVSANGRSTEEDLIYLAKTGAGRESILPVRGINLLDEHYMLRGVYLAFFSSGIFLSRFPSFTTFSVSPARQSPDHWRHFPWSAGTSRKNSPAYWNYQKYGYMSKNQFHSSWYSFRTDFCPDS